MIQRSLGPGSRNKASIAEKYLPTVDVVNAKRLRKNFSGGSMAEPIIIIPYDKEWSLEFQRVGSILRETLGSIAIRIDHIGSTSIVGMDAKPIVDIQISVEYLEPMIYRPMMESVG